MVSTSPLNILCLEVPFNIVPCQSSRSRTNIQTAKHTCMPLANKCCCIHTGFAQLSVFTLLQCSVMKTGTKSSLKAVLMCKLFDQQEEISSSGVWYTSSKKLSVHVHTLTCGTICMQVVYGSFHK